MCVPKMRVCGNGEGGRWCETPVSMHACMCAQNTNKCAKWMIAGRYKSTSANVPTNQLSGHQHRKIDDERT